MSESALDLITEEAALDLGLDRGEWSRIVERLGRAPNDIEAQIFSTLWSEEVGFKSSAAILKIIENTKEDLSMVPGAFGGDLKIDESTDLVTSVKHYDQGYRQDAANGIPTAIAANLLNIAARGAKLIGASAQFYIPELDKSDSLNRFKRSVQSLSDFSQQSGTLLLETDWQIHEGYLGNALCDSICVAIREKASTTPEPQTNDPILLLGAKTGGQKLIKNSSPSPQDSPPTLADPFLHYRLAQALSELHQEGILSGATALHYGGLAVSTIRLSEIIGQVIELDLNRVPHNLSDVTAESLLFSESSGRILLTVPKEQLRKVSQICNKWDIPQQACGKITKTHGIEINYNHKVIADIPLKFALSGASNKEFKVVKFPPMLKAKDTATRAPTAPKKYKGKQADEWSLIRDATSSNSQAKEDFPEPSHLADTWVDILANINFASKRHIVERQDPYLGGQALNGGGGDAKLMRFTKSDSSQLGITVATAASALYTKADPYLAMAHSIALAQRKTASLGGKPLGICFTLHYGHPDKYKDVCDLSESIRALGDSAQHWKIPILDGDISLNNGSDASPLLATPCISMIGTTSLKNSNSLSLFPRDGDHVFLIGKTNQDYLCSEYSRYIHRHINPNAVPNIDFELECKMAEQVSSLVESGLITSCKTLGAGGLGYALAAMAMGGEKPYGVKLELTMQAMRSDAQLFSDTASRYLVFTSTEKSEELTKALADMNIPVEGTGLIGGRDLKITGSLKCSLPVATAYRIWNQASERALG